MSTLRWYGKELGEKILRACAKGIDNITADCVRDAKANVPKVTTMLQGSIQMRPAVMKGHNVAGLWGSFNCAYVLTVELGSPPHIIRPRNKKALYWPGADHPVKLVHHPGTKGKPFLRPAADRLYPQLPARIRSYLS